MAALLDLPLEVLTCVCQHLELRGLVRVSETCTRLRHGDGGLETAELPTKSPVVTALRELAFPLGVGIPSTRPSGCSDSWVAYLARCVRQRRCREAPLLAAGFHHSLIVDVAGRLLACGTGAAVGHGDEELPCSEPAQVTAMAGVPVLGVAAGLRHSLALTWDGRVYSWGETTHGQLGHGDEGTKPVPALVEGLAGVRGVASAYDHCHAVTHSGAVFSWGRAFRGGPGGSKVRPVIVEGFGGVCVRRVCAGECTAFAIGEDGEVFSWGNGEWGVLGHGDLQNQPSPKRVEALRGVRASSVAAGTYHALALAQDGLVYAWGTNAYWAVLGNPHVERELLPRPVEALRGVRVSSIAADSFRSYAVADTGEVWEWGCDSERAPPLGHGEQISCLVPKPIESLQGVKVDAVAVSLTHTLALADDGSVYAWGSKEAAAGGALGLGPAVREAGQAVFTPQRVPLLRVGI
jgi:alpha-tubulin suppressor-like RCC1 family protein